MTGISKRTAIVTGGSSGIGRATAILLGDRGYRVSIGYRSNREGAATTRDTLIEAGGEARIFQLDQREPESAVASIETEIEALGGIDVYINNAGVNRRCHHLDETVEEWSRVLTVNMTSPFACAQVVAKAMMPQRQGSIVNVTSVHERCPIFGGASYCASKAGLSAVTKVLALELAEHGITVNSVAPGETATSMNGAGEGTDATTLQRPSIPVGRPARPSEVAHAIASLCDPESQYLTGESVVVDGGMMLMPAIPNQHDNEGPNLRKKAEQDLSDTSTENGRC